MMLLFLLDWFPIIVIICNNYYKNRQVNTWRFATNFSHSLHWLHYLLRFVNNVFLKNLYLQPKFCTIAWEKTQPLHDAVVYLYFLIWDLKLSYSPIIAVIYHFFINQTVCASFIKRGCLFWKKIWYLWIPKLQKTKCKSSLWCYFFFFLDWFLIIVTMCNNYYKNRQVNTWRFVIDFSHSLHWPHFLLRFVNKILHHNTRENPTFAWCSGLFIFLHIGFKFEL